MELRSYQLKDCGAIRDAFRSGFDAPLYVLPTGGGKTVVLCHIAQAAVQKGGRVLLLVHRRELLDQAVRSLLRMRISAGVIAPGFNKSDKAVQVASVQTMSRRLAQFSPDAFSLVIIDEAHHAVAGSWQTVCSYFGGAKRLGVTATPVRLDGRGLAGQFDTMILGPSPRELERGGFLARSRVYAPPIGFNAAAVRSRMGDYDLGDAEQQVTTVRALGDAVTHYQQLLGGGTAIAFCCTVKHAEAVAETFTAAGIPAESIDGSMTWEQRESKLHRLSQGQLRILTSCMLIGEGVDVPSVNGCIMLRPTKSLSLFLQMVGRCLRPAAGKDAAIILDHVGNYERHGHHMDRREWSLEEGVRKRRDGAAGPALWVCPGCYCNVESRQQECPECGYVRPRQERQVIQVAGQLMQISSSSELEDMAQQWAERGGPLQEGEPVRVCQPGTTPAPGWFVVGAPVDGEQLLADQPVSEARLLAMQQQGETFEGSVLRAPESLLERDVDAYLQLLADRQEQMVDQAEAERKQRAEVEQKREQSKAQSYDELVALGRRRGMKHPTGWAMKILQARQQKQQIWERGRA